MFWIDHVPVATPETSLFWEGLAAGELRLQRPAGGGAAWFPPRPCQPGTGLRDIEWFTASGRGSLYSYVISHMPWPEWGSAQPRSVALVRLAEGPMLVSTIVDCPQTPEALVIDMALQAVIRPYGAAGGAPGHRMLCFAPVPAEAGA